MNELVMVSYIGTKELLATQMTLGAYNKYRGWELPADEDGTDEGMLVEYVNGGKPNHDNHKGYISWSPIDVFNNAYNKSETWRDRVIIEYDALAVKCADLHKALSENKIPSSEVNILTNQLQSMDIYLSILGNRLNNTNKDKGMTFGQAIEALKLGKAIARKGWNANRDLHKVMPMFIFKQIPAEIGHSIIPKMQSVPDNVKGKFIEYTKTIKYSNQIAVVNQDGNTDGVVDGWVPSISSILAEDWYVIK